MRSQRSLRAWKRLTRRAPRRFVVAISEYNQTLFEDSRQNRLDESLELWEMISASRWFRKTTFVLFVRAALSLVTGDTLAYVQGVTAEQNRYI